MILVTIMTLRNWLIPSKDKDTNKTIVGLAKMSQRTIVKPKCIMHLEVKTKFNRINGMFSPLENAPGIQDQTGVMIPRVIIPKRNTFCVPIINMSTSALVLKQGQPIGLIEYLDEQEINETTVQKPPEKK